MTRAQAWLQHLSNLMVVGTGLVFFAMKYLMASDDPYAVVNHPAQPLVQHLHVLAAPLLVFATGAFWASHAALNIGHGTGAKARAGLVLLLSFAPMAASGYLIQVATDTTWRNTWVWLHLGASGLWVAGYLVHAVWRRSVRGPTRDP